ncbi:MAG: hypothetical protein HGB21_09305 [Nitrospirae bacterium]|nr:hypothetical protein [Nitrospirota bacterium]NTW66483.1 hypothetical protein [Nitrospirota bacterium]
MATVLKQTGIHRIRVLSAILLIALAGCASDAHRKMYAGEPVPLDQRAYLHIVGKKEGFNNVFSSASSITSEHHLF